MSAHYRYRNCQQDCTTDCGACKGNPPRHYTTGIPATATVYPDGTVEVTVMLGELGEGVADYADDLDPSTPGRDQQQADDTATVTAAIDRDGNSRIRVAPRLVIATSKGA